MAGKCPLSLLILPSCPGRFWWGGGGEEILRGGEILNKVYTERLDPEVQPFTLSSTNLNRKGALSYTFYREMVPLSHT